MNVLFKNQVQIINKCMLCNGYPQYNKKYILHNTDSNLKKTKTTKHETRNMKKICKTLPYTGVKGESLMTSTITTLQRNFK